jgi:hypothetical protein
MAFVTITCQDRASMGAVCVRSAGFERQNRRHRLRAALVNVIYDLSGRIAQVLSNTVLQTYSEKPEAFLDGAIC